MVLPLRINQRWSMDFVSDQLALGRRFRTLNIIDDMSRECLSIEVGTSLTGTQVVRVLDRLVQLRGRPEVIVMDNGPEFAGHALADWSMKMGIRLHFIRPGKPTENTFAESFTSIFRREFLNEHWFLDMADARQSIEDWRHRYNDRRPHESLGNPYAHGVFTTPRTRTEGGGVMGARPAPSIGTSSATFQTRGAGPSHSSSSTGLAAHIPTAGFTNQVGMGEERAGLCATGGGIVSSLLRSSSDVLTQKSGPKQNCQCRPSSTTDAFVSRYNRSAQSPETVHL
jgi:hypothetical protein